MLRHAQSHAHQGLLYTVLSLALTLTSCAAPPLTETVVQTPIQQGFERAQFIYESPRSFALKDVDLSQLKYLKLSLTGEGLSKVYTHSGSEFIPVNPDGETLLEIADIPMQAGKIRVATVQGYDADKKELTAFQAKGIYRSKSGSPTVNLEVDRRHLLTGKVIEKLITEGSFDSSQLELETLQLKIDQITGFQELNQTFTSDPLLFNASQIQQLIREERLNSETIQTELSRDPVSAAVFLRTANGCAFNQAITLQVNAPGVADLMIAAGSKSPAQPVFNLPVGSWTLSAKSAGHLLAQTQIQIDPSGLVSNSTASSAITAWNPGLTAPVISHYLAKRIAGGGVGDGYLAVDAYLRMPTGMILEADGSLLISDGLRVRKMAPDGTIQTIVGDGYQGYQGDGGSAKQAQISAAKDIVKDEQGNLYLSDTYNHVIRKVDTQGIISTFAGTGLAGFGGDGGPATLAQFKEPGGLFWKDGALYIADRLNARVRKIAADGTISTVAGNGQLLKAEGGLATETSIGGSTEDIVIDSSNQLYIIDGSFSRILKVSPSGHLSTYIGQGNAEVTGSLGAPKDVYIDSAGVFHVVAAGQVFKVENNELVRLAGTLTPQPGMTEIGLLGDGGPALDASLSTPAKVLKDSAGHLYISDLGHRLIRRVDSTGNISTIAGGGVGDNGPATNAYLDYPPQLSFDNTGNLLIADGRFRIRKIDQVTGVITTLAGNGFRNLSGDGGPAQDAQINATYDLLGRPDGSILLASSWSRRIRQIAANGQITTLTPFQYPVSLAPGRDGEVYISDSEREMIYRYLPASGEMTKIAGNGDPNQIVLQENVAALSASLPNLWDIAYVPFNHSLTVRVSGVRKLRKIDLSTGLISTLAGNGERPPIDWNGTEGNGGLAINAPMEPGGGLGSDSCGNIYFNTNGVIRKIEQQNGLISSVAGLPSNTFLEDGSPWPDNLSLGGIARKADDSFYSIIVEKAKTNHPTIFESRHSIYHFIPQYE